MTPRFTVDSNILIYADDDAEPIKQPAARMIVQRAIGRNCFLTQQAIGELLNAGRRRGIVDLVELAAGYRLFFDIIKTDFDQLLSASVLADTRRKQFWDMLIVRVAADAGATVLLTEDIGDGETIAGVRIVNPLNPANAQLLDELLTPLPETA